VSTARPRAGARRRTGPVVAVTGAASGLGRSLAIRLASRSDVGQVVAVDASRGDARGVTWRVLDVRDPGLADRFAGVDVVVHLAVDMSLGGAPAARSSLNVRGTQAALAAAAVAGVGRVVLCTSAMVYGAPPDNPVPLEEDGPIRATPDGGLVGDLLEMERLAARAQRAHPGLTVTVVRPATVVGPGVDSVLTRHFEAPRLLVVRDSRPCWQFCHIEDLVTAVELAALGKVAGAVTVGCDGWLEQEEVERLSGLRRVELPTSLAFAAAGRLHRLGLIPAPPSDLQYVMSPWVVPSSKLREIGWKPIYDNISALQVLLNEVSGHHAVAARRIERREATIAGAGAAGAAVAMMGTAALVRVARRRRRGGAR
jgi:nucleoside-diphosphate-sugar epimerase